MTTKLGRTTAAMAAIAGLLAGCGVEQAPSDWSEPAGQNWPMVNGDWSNTRYSSLDQITPANVGELGAAWVRDFESNPSRANPVVSGGKMFVTVGADAYALDPATGETIWQVTLPTSTSGLYKGVSVGEGKVFIGLSNAHIAALSQETGELLWEGIVGDEPPLRGQSVPAGPSYHDGVVLTGMANGDFGFRGRIVALDSNTGEQIWRFDTVPGPGEPGHETWQQDNDEWMRGGAGAWTIPAIDTELGLAYFGVGNPVPQWGGELRGGINLYSDSVIALDVKTGEMRWYYQIVHHDIWEADLGTPPVLFEDEFDGAQKKALGILSAAGYLFVLDRVTGEPLIPVEERPVPQNERVKTHPTQPFVVGADQIGPACTPEDQVPSGFVSACLYDPVDYDQPNVMYPLVRTRAAPSAYSPKTGHIYATAAVAPRWLIRYENPLHFVAGANVPGMKSYGLIAAVDGQTSKLAWEHDRPYRIENGSGMTATAGGLLFHGDPDGHMQAFSAETGELLWQFQTGANANGSPGVYESGGEQYVAQFAQGRLWAFKLGGTVEPAEAPPAPRTESGFAGRIVPSDEITMGVMVSDTGLEIVREAFDEYAVSPVRTRVEVGQQVTFTNGGKETHEAVAMDGSWSTGPIAPGRSVTITFDQEGTYAYTDAGFPWTRGEITVDPK